jgi:hypothetical protein
MGRFRENKTSLTISFYPSLVLCRQTSALNDVDTPQSLRSATDAHSILSKSRLRKMGEIIQIPRGAGGSRSGKGKGNRGRDRSSITGREEDEKVPVKIDKSLFTIWQANSLSLDWASHLYYPLRALPPYDNYLNDIYLPLPFYTTYLHNISHELQQSTIIL